MGDSLTEGVGDAGRSGLRGWVHYLVTDSPAAPELTLVANLARYGTTVDSLRARQLDRAVAMAPDIATCVIGVNDVLGSGFAAAAFEAQYDHVVASLTKAANRGVLTMTLHDVAAGLPLPPYARAALRGRIRQANAVIERVSQRRGAWLVETRGGTAIAEPGMLSIDRLHPSRRGHRYLAAMAADVLCRHGAVAQVEPAAVALPPVDPVVPRMIANARHLQWLCRHIARPLIGAYLARQATGVIAAVRRSPPGGPRRGTARSRAAGIARAQSHP